VSMIKHKESEVLGKYLTSEELWLRDVQRERGGRVYLETLGEKMVIALAVALQGGDEATANRGRALFDMVFGMAGEYALMLGDEALSLRIFLRGVGDSMADSGVQISEMPEAMGVESDDPAYRAGMMLARHLRVVMVWTDTKWAVKNLREQIAMIESVDEVRLRKFVSGIRNGLVQRGIIENEKRETA